LRPQPLRWSIAILVSGFICYLLTRHLAGPVLRLQTAARQLSEGNLAARATPALENRRDELGVLVRDFNYMAERIERLVRTQQELIRDISHELRSPLARLTVALELARKHSGAEAQEALERIELESERLNELIGRLLTLARIQSATAPPERSAVSLRSVIEDIAADARFEAVARGCNVIVDGARDCVVQGSPELLRSAIENVVRNSIRYTAPQTNIEVSLECGAENGRTAVVHIRDHGPGVPETELQNLFRPFYRVASARERETGGTGIGLAITQEAMRLHGGTARAQNAAGGGLDVELRLPLQT
jgi:two-component system sensor histidine kinase CpxA